MGSVSSAIVAGIFSGGALALGLVSVSRAFICSLAVAQGLFFCPSTPACADRPYNVEIALTVFLSDVVSGLVATIDRPDVQSLVARTIETVINEADGIDSDCPTADTVIVNLRVAEVTIIDESVGSSSNRRLFSSSTTVPTTTTTTNDAAPHNRLLQPSGGPPGPESGLFLVLVGFVQSLEGAEFLSDASSLQIFTQQVQTVLSSDLATPVEVQAASVGAVVPCPQAQPLESLSETFLITTRNPTSDLQVGDADDLVRACVMQYAQLDTSSPSCNPTFLNLQGCSLNFLETEGRRRLLLPENDNYNNIEENDDDMRQRHRRLAFDSGLRLTLQATGYVNRASLQSSGFFSGVRRRRRLEEQQQQDKQASSISAPTTLRSSSRSSSSSMTSSSSWMRSSRRRLQAPPDGDDVCICPVNDDQTEQAVDFDDFVTSLNTSVPALDPRQAVVVQDQPCTMVELFELDVPVAITTQTTLSPSMRLQIQQLLKETLNTLSLDNCPETLVFITTVQLSDTPDGSGLMATYTGRCATIVPDGTPQCSQEIFSAARRQLQQQQQQHVLWKARQKNATMVVEHVVQQQQQVPPSPQDNNQDDGLMEKSFSSFSSTTSLGLLSVSIEWDEALLPQRYRRLGEGPFRFLQAVDFPCYCRIGMEVGGDITVMEYNTLLMQELPNYVNQITAVEVSSNAVP